jgi:hypothetical protein
MRTYRKIGSIMQLAGFTIGNGAHVRVRVRFFRVMVGKNDSTPLVSKYFSNDGYRVGVTSRIPCHDIFICFESLMIN